MTMKRLLVLLPLLLLATPTYALNTVYPRYFEEKQTPPVVGLYIFNIFNYENTTIRPIFFFNCDYDRDVIPEGDYFCLKRNCGAGMLDNVTDYTIPPQQYRTYGIKCGVKPSDVDQYVKGVVVLDVEIGNETQKINVFFNPPNNRTSYDEGQAGIVLNEQNPVAKVFLYPIVCLQRTCATENLIYINLMDEPWSFYGMLFNSINLIHILLLCGITIILFLL
jgi:hypothetical protein